MPSTTHPTLTADTIDDLIYYTRTSDLSALKTELTAQSNTHNTSPSSILEASVDAESGNTLLHYAGANGDEETLAFLLTTLPTPHLLVNHANNQGNTALHWTALNHHLPLLKRLVAAGADPAVQNLAGHDAVFEAERAIGDEGEEETDEGKRGRECVEWLLGCKEAGGLERGVKGGREVEGEGVDGEGAGEDGVAG